MPDVTPTKRRKMPARLTPSARAERDRVESELRAQIAKWRIYMSAMPPADRPAIERCAQQIEWWIANVLEPAF